MKKGAFVCAVLGALASAATAQSSVTIYGLVDLAVTKGNGGTAPNAGANGASKDWLMKQSTSSRLGFRGNEDIGGGLSAQFQIEHRFTPDNGAAANPFWAGRSYVQLSSNSMGRVYLGREYSPAFYPASKSDPFGWNGVGQAGSAMWAGYSSPQNVPGAVGVTGVRTSNTLGYKSPNLGGLTLQAAYALGEGVLGRDLGLSAEYSQGPIYAALGYETMRGKGSDPSSVAADGNSLLNLAFHYDFGFIKPMVYFARSKVDAGTVDPTSAKYFHIGTLIPAGPGRIKVGYGVLNPEGSNNNSSKLGIGYDYRLSKRTTLYADAGFARADRRSSNNAYALGILHTF